MTNRDLQVVPVPDMRSKPNNTNLRPAASPAVPKSSSFLQEELEAPLLHLQRGNTSPDRKSIQRDLSNTLEVLQHGGGGVEPGGGGFIGGLGLSRAMRRHSDLLLTSESTRPSLYGGGWSYHPAQVADPFRPAARSPQPPPLTQFGARPSGGGE